MPEPSFKWGEYVVLGHAGAWNSGEWDPRWSAAELGTETKPLPGDPDAELRPTLHALTAGDLDGDGLSDLLAAGPYTAYVFYGNAERFHGTLDADQADASMPLALGQQLVHLGDLDGDGADDLATGIPDDDEVGGGCLDCGLVIVRWGARGSGLAQGLATTYLHQGLSGSGSPPVTPANHSPRSSTWTRPSFWKVICPSWIRSPAPTSPDATASGIRSNGTVSCSNSPSARRSTR